MQESLVHCLSGLNPPSRSNVLQLVGRGQITMGVVRSCLAWQICVVQVAAVRLKQSSPYGLNYEVILQSHAQARTRPKFWACWFKGYGLELLSHDCMRAESLGTRLYTTSTITSTMLRHCGASGNEPHL